LQQTVAKEVITSNKPESHLFFIKLLDWQSRRTTEEKDSAKRSIIYQRRRSVGSRFFRTKFLV